MERLAKKAVYKLLRAANKYDIDGEYEKADKIYQAISVFERYSQSNPWFSIMSNPQNAQNTPYMIDNGITPNIGSAQSPTNPNNPNRHMPRVDMEQYNHNTDEAYSPEQLMQMKDNYNRNYLMPMLQRYKDTQIATLINYYKTNPNLVTPEYRNNIEGYVQKLYPQYFSGYQTHPTNAYNPYQYSMPNNNIR